ncbi:MAG: hypothetical protein JWQ07_610 [Ramlibacter sp.]|nr:hypothetical protein [Ramlibacter sp.]
MPDQSRDAGPTRGRLELAVTLLVAWLAFIAVPLGQYGMGLSWDALNHHIYLGWIAGHPRFDQDFLAAGYQSLQFPYLYWPVYKLAAWGAGPTMTGVALATLHVVAVPPVWMIARTCIPGPGPAERAMRFMAVVLAFQSAVVLSLFDSSSNDLLAAAPLVWSVALALEGAFGQRRRLGSRSLAILSGLLAGAAIACKFSNGPLVVVLPLLWIFCGASARERVLNTTMACLAVVLGLVVTYGYWGAQLWTHFGNPIYPFLDSAFDPVRNWWGWTP